VLSLKVKINYRKLTKPNLVSAHQVEMEDRQAPHKPHTDEAVDDQDD
jgi:hypothetical protein